jgi:hypothetical protein
MTESSNEVIKHSIGMAHEDEAAIGALRKGSTWSPPMQRQAVPRRLNRVASRNDLDLLLFLVLGLAHSLCQHAIEWDTTGRPRTGSSWIILAAFLPSLLPTNPSRFFPLIPPRTRARRGWDRREDCSWNLVHVLGPRVSDQLWKKIVGLTRQLGLAITVDLFASESKARAERFATRNREPIR